MANPRTTTTKRQRERAKREKKEQKAERRARRAEQRRDRSENVDGDPDLAGIVPGPQPIEPD